MKIKYFSYFSTSGFLPRLACIIGTAALLSACSMGQMVVRGSQTILDSGSAAMNRETDLELAAAAIPANLKLIEGMLIEDPNNRELLLFAAEGFYGYSYGFVERDDPARAGTFYRRCQDYALRALALDGIHIDPGTDSETALQSATAGADRGSVPALFWAASCLAKGIDLNRDDISSIAGLSGAAVLMQRVLELDDEFYYGGAYLFFGVYYGGRSPMFGGDFARAEQNFRHAAGINNNKLLLVDLLWAEYLHRQQLDRPAFHERLVYILEAPDDLYPEMALVNAIARQRAAQLLTQEDEWF
jgi:hypothetical protein